MDANNQIDLTKIEWCRTTAPLEEKDMYLLNQLPCPLPKRYIELLKISNGGGFKKDTFNGDLICFDYRSDPQSDNPPIVYWNHEADEDGNAFFIAKDLDAFLSMLYAEED